MHVIKKNIYSTGNINDGLLLITRNLGQNFDKSQIGNGLLTTQWLLLSHGNPLLDKSQYEPQIKNSQALAPNLL